MMLATPAREAADPGLRLGVAAAGLRWRLRCEGEGPDLLLLHGTGSSLHAWQACSRLLRPHFRVWSPDLPGHGHSSGWADGRASLPRMAQALADLLDQQACRPQLVAGQSAGAALMMQMVLDGRIRPRGLLAVNGAVLPLQGLAGLVFPPMARWLEHRAWLPRWVARRATEPQALTRLMASTGSRLDGQALANYAALLQSPAHVQGALSMMANWQLDPLVAALPRLSLPVWLAVGSRDGTVPPAQATELARRLPQARVLSLPGLGHLAQEEDPEQVAALLNRFWAELPP